MKRNLIEILIGLILLLILWRWLEVAFRGVW